MLDHAGPDRAVWRTAPEPSGDMQQRGRITQPRDHPALSTQHAYPALASSQTPIARYLA
jgi:hypothetical protein